MTTKTDGSARMDSLYRFAFKMDEPSLRPGAPGGSEELTQAYSAVRRGERRSDNARYTLEGELV